MSFLVVMALAHSWALGPSHPVRWQSPERFAQSADLRVRVYVNRRELLASEWPKNCVARYYSRGVVVSLNTCGRMAPIRVEAASVRKVRLTLRYRQVR